MLVADAQRRPVEPEHRVWIRGLGVRGQLLPGARLREPRRRGRIVVAEPEGRRGAGPGERDAAAVARVPGAVPARVLELLLGDVLDLPQPELLALVDVGAAGQRER